MKKEIKELQVIALNVDKNKVKEVKKSFILQDKATPELNGKEFILDSVKKMPSGDFVAFYVMKEEQ